MAFTLGNSFAALDDEAALKLAAAAATTTTAKTQQEQKKKPQSATVTPIVIMPPKPLILPEEVLRRNLIFGKPKTINQLQPQPQALSNNGKNNFSNSDKNKMKPEEENKQRNPAQVVEAHRIPNQVAFPGKFMGKVSVEAKPALDIEDPIQFPVLGKK